ncbi:hypothetical protein [Pseudalkalibacillus sp. JSM 102089]|uniref:hypothetical protein n=1 Tax=Pseudalkalibacillus sp. JSM 102089 TaxID=3229856 RepID=UPI003525F11D
MDSQNERIAKLEEQSKGHTDHYDRLYETMLRMETKLDTYTTNFLPRTEAQEMFRSRDEDIKENRESLEKLENEIKNDSRSNKAILPAWFAVAISIIVGILSLITIIL